MQTNLPWISAIRAGNSWAAWVFRSLLVFGAVLVLGLPSTLLAQATSLRLATFDVDATPPVGSIMAYDPVRRLDELTLRCRGIVLLGAGDPLVLCAVDWIGIGNESQDVFRAALAEAVGTTSNRVAVHTLHQHDAPTCDFGAEQVLLAAGITNLGSYSNSDFQRAVLRQTCAALTASLAQAQAVTHVGWGVADVQHVASNRRILGPDGKIRAMRYTATEDPVLRAEPEGTIDPEVSLVSFWNAETPLAVLSYYACHPQSYYRTGVPSPDFPGIARFIRGQAVPEALHVHFNGAGGNIGAGKYNDGSKANRLILAQRLADGMLTAWEATQRIPVTAADVTWTVEPVHLPLAPHLNESALREELRRWDPTAHTGTADRLAWVLRNQRGLTIDVACLGIGPVRVLHLPGELFVEYQLAAKAMRPDLHVAMAAYGDAGPWYIGTAVAYGEGGYETGPTASNVAPEVQSVLMDAIKKVLPAK